MGNKLNNSSFLICFMLSLGIIFDLYFMSNGSNRENSNTIGYKGGYIVLNEA